MKRLLDDGIHCGSSVCEPCVEDESNKKVKLEEEEMSKELELVLMDENLLYEIFRRLEDGSSLAKVACVCRQWNRTANDERLWELICTKNYQRSPLQLRSVVSALGGFRRLYSSHLWPLLKPSSSSSSSATPSWPSLPLAPAPPPGSARPKARWGKDEVNLSVSLLSLKYFEMISSKNRRK